jgi:hypothetical protein
VVTEKAAQHFGEGEDHLPVRQAQEQLLVHVLAEQQGAFLRTKTSAASRGILPDPARDDRGHQHAVDS